MKLTVKNGKVIFDFSDINSSTLVTNKDYAKAMQARHFLRQTTCGWELTETEQVNSMAYEPNEWATEYGNAMKLKSLLANCECNAMYMQDIEITEEFEQLIRQTEIRCAKLREMEIEKEKALERQAKWDNLCKYGCGGCKNLCYKLDVPFCKKTDTPLTENNMPQYRGGILRLFNLMPFPSSDCPFAV